MRQSVLQANFQHVMCASLSVFQANFLHVMCASLMKNDAEIMMGVHATAPQELASTANGVVLSLIAGDTIKVYAY